MASDDYGREIKAHAVLCDSDLDNGSYPVLHNMTQSRWGSAREATVNMTIGFGIAWLTWEVIVQPLFNMTQPPKTGFAITCIFTVVSWVRVFVIRRATEWWAWEKVRNKIRRECLGPRT